MRILVLGASGLIGRTMFRVLAQCPDWDVSGSIRSETFDGNAPGPVLLGMDLSIPDNLARVLDKAKPDVVVNCVGLTKHLHDGNEPIPALTMNALLPHRLAVHCALSNARLIHVSTDCVFSGTIGKYTEKDTTDATDVYGRSKGLGEVTAGNVLTLRTSTIGHEYGTRRGLLEWFLAQQSCKGFRYAIFSGLPTVEFARIVREVVIPKTSLSGLYHVGASPIDKLSLLLLIAKVYQRRIKIAADETVCIDRSLNVEKFFDATGYRAPAWPTLIEAMYQDHLLEK